MEVVQPIRDLEMLNSIIKSLKEHGPKKYYLIFLLGIYSGLRVSDLIKLKVNEIKNKDEIFIKEKKTSKTKIFPIKEKVKKEINQYILDEKLKDTDFLFQGHKTCDRSIHRSQVYRRINEAAKECGFDEKIGTHSMRKTFGYHFYKQTQDLALLQNIFNHSSAAITLRYIGINQDIINQAYYEFEYNNTTKRKSDERIENIEKMLLKLMKILGVKEYAR